MEEGGNRPTHAADFAAILDAEVGGGTLPALLTAGAAAQSHQSLGEPVVTALPHQPAELDAVIFDYNGVIGLQPTVPMWSRLAELAGWHADQLGLFMNAFWSAREPYDSGEFDDTEFWTTVLGHRPEPELLTRLRAVDTTLWTRTDERVVALLHHARRADL
ncbi:hypothetical protein ACWEO2_43140, partial [Nocardia sp. NPDC004278]